MKYRLTVAAEEDLIGIFLEGSKLFGEPQAERYLRGLETVFGLIADNPEMARERTEISPPVRIHPHASHLIAYRIAETTVQILRIRHAREDWQPDAD